MKRKLKRVRKRRSRNAVSGARRRGPAKKQRKIRRNPSGSIRYVWIWPDGDVLKIPSGRGYLSAVPSELKQKPDLATAARKGFFCGAIINRRLYVERVGSRRPTEKQLTKIRSFARSENLSRGVVVEQNRIV